VEGGRCADVEEVLVVGEGLADLRGGVESARDAETEEALNREKAERVCSCERRVDIPSK
jgi:hypothetical protein